MSQPDQLDPSSIQWLVRSAGLLTQYRAITGNLQAASRVEAGNVQLVTVAYSGDNTTVEPLSPWIPAALWLEYMQALIDLLNHLPVPEALQLAEIVREVAEGILQEFRTAAGAN